MDALVIGESVLDVVRAPGRAPVERPGGSAVNVAVALARLGRPVRLATSYGDDPAGALVAAHLRAAGVAPAGSPLVLGATSRAEAVIGADGGASYTFEMGWALPSGLDADLDLEGDGAVHVVHVTSQAPLLAPGAADTFALVERLRGAGATITYDINLRPAITGTGPDVADAVLRMAALADVVKASDEDLLALWPDRFVGESATALLALDGGPVAVVVTHGGEGASWHACSGADWSTGGVHAPPVDVADTIGAGDTFAAALVDHLWPLLGPGGRERICALAPDDWAAALAYAARAAAVTVGRVGADPPTREDLDALEIR
ncbi:carbohydrate kinase [Pimelobacter simplex]|uniref:PfkB family carbohydrate kinase n=1 Tax=Nocardioides simplex TaxID=2045 RepID=UPI000535F3F6|nr:PfkB family carbohydrate kinase [Pimelobacter simplex]MCG8154332.1 carbohydrate kinase [Pimelobacter simplex]GEB11771.1 ribokinase [Pimelobacter simplex]SFN01443.1 fructokinase [Pimelobacter simplex]